MTRDSDHRCRSSWAIVVAWASTLAVGVALAALAAREHRLPGDLRIAREVQSWPAPGETFSGLVRALTATEPMVAAGAALAGGLWLAGRRRSALAFGAAVAALPLLQWGLKELVDRPRPAPDLVELRAGFSSPSFPAGHVMSPTLWYGYVLWIARAWRPRWFQTSVQVACALVLASTGLVNVYLGVHWPSDVAGGYVWGLALLIPAAARSDGWPPPDR